MIGDAVALLIDTSVVIAPIAGERMRDPLIRGTRDADLLYPACLTRR